VPWMLEGHRLPIFDGPRWEPGSAGFSRKMPCGTKMTPGLSNLSVRGSYE
jgi:hypothetical protein